jgi:peptide/nickel transport system substrate-binding protein
MRIFRLLSIIIVLSLVLAACAPASPPPVTTPVVEAEKSVVEAKPEATTAVEEPVVQPDDSMYKESPMLAEKVKAGALPAVDDRLPNNPRVIKSLTGEQGAFGGEMRVGFVGASPEWGGLLFVAAWEHMVSWKPDFSGYEFNIAESIEASDDVTEYTIHLRKGLKWSDGQPYTADDIMFYIEDVMFNEELSPNGPTADWLPTDMAADFKAEKVDDFTVKLIFPNPYGTFLYNLATWGGRAFSMYPKHYLMQFHAKYNDKITDLITADGNVTDWMALFFKMGPDNWGNPLRWYEFTQMPSLYPWIVTQPLGSGTQIRLERNPYYWKVDEQGNQLPYIDTILGISYQDAESRTFAMLNGDLDFAKDPGNENRIIYHEAMADGKPLQIKYPQSDGANVCSIHFNLTLEDPIKSEVFNNKDFRIGMSHAIDRAQVIEIIFDGQGDPAQVAPVDGSPFFIDGMDKQYTEYNVALANEYLDKVLPDKDSSGRRLGKDGKPFAFVFTVQNDLSFGTFYVQLAELLVKYWKDVGIEATINSMPGPQMDEAKRKNLPEASIYTGEGGAGITPILDPRYYAPLQGAGIFSNAWAYWRVPDATGEAIASEPPQWAKDAYAKYELVLRQPTQEEQIIKMRDVIKEAKERFYVIGISRSAPMYYPFHARLGGIPDTWYDGWNEGVQKILYPEQWFLK